MLKLGFETYSEQSDTGFFFKAKDIGHGKEFEDILESRASLLKHEKTTTKGIMTLFVSIYRRHQSPESLIVVEDVIIYFKKGMVSFSRTFAAARDNKCDFHIIVIEARMVHMKVGIAVIDKYCILKGFTVEFRGIYNFWLFSRDDEGIGVCQGGLAYWYSSNSARRSANLWQSLLLATMIVDRGFYLKRGP